MSIPVIDICIASYKRVDGLGRLLQSIAALTPSQEFSVRVSVADNDAAGSARAICERFQQQGLNLVYTNAGPPNIAVARNAAIDAVDGDWIAIVDDDETVDPDWLNAYWQAAKTTDCQVLHGPVQFDFPPGSSPTLQQSMVFTRAPELEDGASIGYERSTTNCFVKRAALSELDQLFNPLFGTSGGEDTDFFMRLADAGTRFGWASQARTTEHATPARMRYRWVTHRYFRFGTNLARHERLRLGPDKIPARARLHARWAVRAVARSLVELLRRRRTNALNAVLRACFNGGYVFNAMTGWSFKRYW